MEIPFSKRRLERIVSLIESSEYSIHDMSRVQLDRNMRRERRGLICLSSVASR